MIYLAAYFVLGILVCTIVAVFGLVRRHKDFAPLSFLFLGSDAISLLVGFLLWPIWVVLQIVEWYWPSPSLPAETTAPTNVVTLGAIGQATCDLRPGGKVRIGSAVVDAVAAFGMIQAGQEIVVVEHTPTGVRVELSARSRDNPN
jgi:membrane-bound ClpP family serine protease